MPRPKRAKVALTTARVGGPSAAQKQFARNPIALTAHDGRVTPEPCCMSDDSDGLVVKSKHPQPKRSGVEEMTMTGALPIEEVRRGPSSTKSRQTSAQSEHGQGLVSAGARGRRSQLHAVRSSSSSPPNVQARDHLVHEEHLSKSGDHLFSFTSLGSDSPAHGTRPPSAIKVGATPAHEQSILALTNFRRRPRQPSLLRMLQQTTDVEDNTDVTLDLSDLDDFTPQAISTPMHPETLATTIQPVHNGQVSVSSSDLRRSKRKLSPQIQVPRSSPCSINASCSNVGASRSPSPSLPEILQSTEEAQAGVQQALPEIFSETMAPPISSSDHDQDESDNAKHSYSTTTRSRRVELECHIGLREQSATRDASSRPAKTRKGISTAHLQAMLPRRRTRAIRRKNDDFDIHSSGHDGDLVSDQDELSLPAKRVTSRRQGHAAAAAPKSKSMASSAQLPDRKSKPTSRVKLSKKDNTKTYGRRELSDKENVEQASDEDEDNEAGSSSIFEEDAMKQTRSSSKALAVIAKKFAEIDEFDLDFESVSYVHSSSPMR